ncbi:tripartite motif-containing protein 29-like [Oncorhynchus kisutch]|uniref:tripartite motif-containing protein 29-like n=1 Tax=Oncorhynchus kisutch TaxID=8019 RepID=UPI0012DF6F28|nr:tripartite motif-containing protein 29-like [Oncorhynchus kisutch]
MLSSVLISPSGLAVLGRAGRWWWWSLGAGLGGEAEAGGAYSEGVTVGVEVVPVPGHAWGPERAEEIPRGCSALPSLETLVGGSLSNGNRPRNRSTVLTEVVEKLKKTGLQAAPPPALCYAGPGDVVCDVCSGTRKQKALMSCLACLASYCETHLQPHYESPAFKKHKLVKATAQLQEKICSHHDKLLEVYCRTDQQCICLLCVMDEHKGHDTVSAAAERTEKQRQLGMSQQKVQQRFQERKKELKKLQQAVKSFKVSIGD